MVSIILQDIGMGIGIVAYTCQEFLEEQHILVSVIAKDVDNESYS